MTASLPPRLPFDVPSYLTQTQHLSTAEHGALFLIYIAYWNNRGPLLRSDSNLAKISRMTGSEWKTIKDTVLAFFEDDHGYLRCQWLDEAMKAAGDRRSAHQKGAQQTNSARWGSESPSESLNLESDDEGKPPWEKAFDEQFWPKYPRKIDKKGCKTTFKRLVNHDKVHIDRILRGLDWWLTSDQWEKENGTYVPHPATWLNQRRWEAAEDQIVAQREQESNQRRAAGRTVVISGRRYTPELGPRRSEFETDLEHEQALSQWSLWSSRF